jgi:hypothetical protein
MAGGLIQLVSIGLEDLYLSSEPEITFFKIVYKRHTNFSQEPVKQLFSTSPDFGKRVSCTLSKTADLLSTCYLFIELPEVPKNNSNLFEKFKWTKKIGFNIINSIELEINGKIIDKLYGDWLNIWSLLTVSNDRESEDILIGNVPSLYNSSNGINSYNLYVPICFFFNRNKGLAIPVIALHLSDIKIHIDFNSLENVLIKSPTHYIQIEENICLFEQGEVIKQNYNNNEIEMIFEYFDYKTKRLYYTKYDQSFSYYQSSSIINKSNYKIYNEKNYYVMPSSEEVFYSFAYPNISINDSYLILNFIYLDNTERKKIAQTNHEYLITTLQYTGERKIYNTNAKVKLNFINPSKEIFWVAQLNKIKNGNIKEKFNYTSNIQYSGSNLVLNSQIHHNGQNRSAFFDKNFYNYVKTHLFHSNTIEEGINMYSFSIDPQNYEPRGSCNFTKIEDIVLDLNLSTLVSYDNPILLRVYNLSYNIFRINNGLAGLTFI